MLLFFHETGENRSIPPPYGSNVTTSSIFGFSKVSASKKGMSIGTRLRIFNFLKLVSLVNLRGLVDFEPLKGDHDS